MNRIVRENYPVAELPEDLREGLARDGLATITIEVEVAETDPGATIHEVLKARRSPWLTAEQVQAQMDELREDRDL